MNRVRTERQAGTMLKQAKDTGEGADGLTGRAVPSRGKVLSIEF